jgi:aspartate/methionine/tyrosine aminotransferase
MSVDVHIARRMADIQPFHVMALLARARELEAQGRDIVHMEIGEPDFETPAPVMAAAQRALAEGRTYYTPAFGLPALREAIARYYRVRHGVEIPARRIVVTPGASGALLLALAALVNPGERVLMTDPGYPCNRHFVRLLEGEAVAVPVTAEQAFQLTPERVAQHWDGRTVAAMVASPGNPTGTVLSGDELAGLAEAVHGGGGRLLVDEIYHGLVYGPDLPTALSVSDELFVINSFSKYFCMTGWRLGWLVVPEAYVDEVEKLAQNLFIAPPTLSQYAALAAFSDENMAILEQRREEFSRRRDFLLSALRHLGFRIPAEPRGAFYLYADCSAHTNDSYALATDLLEKAGVAITPGIDFGDFQASRHLRFAYTTSMEGLAEGVQRLGRFLGV